MTSIHERAIDAKAIAALRARFRGALLRPDEEGYDEARRIWNGAIDRRTDSAAFLPASMPDGRSGSAVAASLSS